MGFRFRDGQFLRLETPEAVCEKAREIQNLGGSDSERLEKKIRKLRIKEKILDNELIAFQWAIGHVTSDGSARRVNGQHSAEVFLELTEEEWKLVEFPIIVAESHYENDTPRDRAFLFNQFDPNWSSRNREDQLGPHLALHHDLKDMDRFAANKATQGLLWYVNKVEGAKDFRERVQYEMLHKNSDIHRFLHFFRDLKVDKRNRTELGMKPVVAAMYHTTRGGQAPAEAFWGQISSGTGIAYSVEGGTESLQYKLAAFLEQARDPHPKWDRTVARKFQNEQKPNDVEIFATCLRLYLAHAKGVTKVETVEKLRHRTPREVIESLQPLAPAAAAD